MITEIEKKEEWKQFIDDGNKYLKTAINGSKRKEIFTPNLLYNIVAMAIEKYFMGYLLYHKKMPENHTLGDLARSVKEVSSIDNDLARNIAYMDAFQEICALDTHKLRIPNEEDIEVFFNTGKGVQAFVMSQLSLNLKVRKLVRGN